MRMVKEQVPENGMLVEKNLLKHPY